MKTQSKYTKSFVSDLLTREKYNELYNHAVYLRGFKNKLSLYVNGDVFTYLEMTKFEFLKHMRSNFEKVNSNFDSHAITVVYNAYENKFEAIKKRLDFEVKTFQGFEFYKRDTKKKKKGELKKVVFIKKKTPLTIALTYLARYGNEGTVEYIKSQLNIVDVKKQEFYKTILSLIDKYGFERLYNLALARRNRIIHHYAKKPIEFKSLTFSGRSRKRLIVDYNKNYNSIINAFISLSWEGRKSMDIPIKFSKDYHGRMRDYEKRNPDYEYVITFNERTKQVRINICKDGEREIPTVDSISETVGIDVNVKHNLLSLSNGETYDYDRQLLKDYAKLCKEIDKLKEDKPYNIGRRKQWKLDVLKHKMQKREEQLISDMCKKLQTQGIRHIVMENLDNGFGKSYVKVSTNEDINFNRVVKFLGISSLKGMVEHIARNYDIALSTVHSSYTSKMCPICGCIEDENRPNQETFECIECGYSSNADLNAAINIRNRVTVTVLRDSLLKQLDNGAFEPRKLKREKVKEVLLSFRRNLAKQGSECDKSTVSTFDYV